MISLPSNTCIWLVAGVTDMRRGMNLYIKRLEEGHFVWPSAHDGKISLTRSQRALLPERFYWRHPVRQKRLNSLNML